MRNAIEKAEMKREVRASVAAMMETNRELEQRNEEISSVYHAVSHQLKTPLSVACEHISLVLEGFFGEPSAEMAEFLNSALERCRIAARCVDDVSESVVVDSEEFALCREDALLVDVVRRASAEVASLAERRGIGIRLDVEEDLGPVSLDVSRVRHVLVHLLENALRHSPDSGEVTILIGSECPGTQFVSVADEGEGLDAIHVERVFDRLYQADLDVTQGGGGARLGLGLYLSRRIIREHGGDIIASSTPGAGALFQFTLPAEIPAKAS